MSPCGGAGVSLRLWTHGFASLLAANVAMPVATAVPKTLCGVRVVLILAV